MTPYEVLSIVTALIFGGLTVVAAWYGFTAVDQYFLERKKTIEHTNFLKRLNK